MRVAFPYEWRIPLWTIIAILITVAGTTAAGRFNEMRHLAGLNLTQTDDYAVHLSFEPERFHIEAFQDVGRYQGWHDDHAVIMAVDLEGLRHLARNYWVDAIRPITDAK